MSNFVPDNSISLEDGIQLYEQRAQQALALLASKGFGTPTPPMVSSGVGMMPYQGHLPANLPELNDDQLGYYLGLLTEWNNYVQNQLAEVSVHLTKVNEILEHVEAKLRIAYGRDEEDKKRTVSERDDYMKVDRRYLEANGNVIYWETLHTHIRAIANSSEQAYAAVSRRITQRGQEIDRGNRSNNVQNIPSGPMFGRNRT